MFIFKISGTHTMIESGFWQAYEKVWPSILEDIKNKFDLGIMLIQSSHLSNTLHTLLTKLILLSI